MGPQFDVAFDGVKPIGDLPKRSDGYIELLTNLLLVEHFLKRRFYTVRMIKIYKAFMPLFLNSYKQVVDRVVGMGMNFIKFHLPLHSASDIVRFGPPMSSDGSNGESGHIPMKHAAKKTRQNTATFDDEVAGQHSQGLMIDRAIRQITPPPSFLPQSTTCNRNQDGGQQETIRGLSYYVTKDGMFVQQRVTAKNKAPVPAIWPDDSLRERVQSLITLSVLPFAASGIVKLYTELKWTPQGTIFRANPSYGKDKSQWHDWADIDWYPSGNSNVQDIVPARLVIYFHLPDYVDRQDMPDQPDRAFEYHPLVGPGWFAIVQSLLESLYAQPTTRCIANRTTVEEQQSYLAHGYCSIVYWSAFERDFECLGDSVPTLRVVPTSAISDTCVAVPYSLFDAQFDNQWLIIAPYKKWNEAFAEEMSSTNKRHRNANRTNTA